MIKFRSNKIFIFISLVSVVHLIIGVPVQAMDNADIQSIYKDTVWYDQSQEIACGVAGSDTSTNVPVGGDNQETAYLYFIQQGFTPIQSAAIIGNFMQESRMDPTVENGIGAYGIAQWLNGRRDNLETFADDKSGEASDLNIQLQFVWYELQGSEKGAYDKFKPIKDDLNAATESWMLHYERPGEAERALQKRIDFAEEIYTLYTGRSPTTILGDDAGTINCNTLAGQNTQYIDDFTVYDQCDPDWGSLPFGNGETTICDSGCGPTAMAMIITTLTGKAVTPVETIKVADQNDIYVSGDGSRWTVAPILAKEYGLNAEQITGSIDAINTALRSGALVITSGSGSVPFTSGGHYIVIRGVTADGKWMVGDSAHKSANTQEWDAQQIFNNLTQANVWAISN